MIETDLRCFVLLTVALPAACLPQHALAGCAMPIDALERTRDPTPAEVQRLDRERGPLLEALRAALKAVAARCERSLCE